MKLMSGGRRLVGLGHKPSKLAIPGSNPGDRTNYHFFPLNGSYLQNYTLKTAFVIYFLEGSLIHTLTLLSILILFSVCIKSI